LRIEALQRGFEIVKHCIEAAPERSAPSDQHIVAVRAQKRGAHDQGTQASSYPVALYRRADLFRDSEADAGRSDIAAIARLNHESWNRDTRACGGGEEVSPLPQSLHLKKCLDRAGQALRRLRPRARRAARTLRPPAVARRARNPWRRLRTSLEG
jgi:hypothetical protein